VHSQTDKQTNKPTNNSENITSFSGGDSNLFRVGKYHDIFENIKISKISKIP